MEDNITFKNQMKVGNRLRVAGQEREAIDLYKKTAELADLTGSERAQALHMWGVCATNLGELDDASELLARAFNYAEQDARQRAHIERDMSRVSYLNGHLDMANIEARQSAGDFRNLAYGPEVTSLAQRQELLDEMRASQSFYAEILWHSGHKADARQLLAAVVDQLGRRGGNRHYYLNAAMRLFKYSPADRYLAWGTWWKALLIARADGNRRRMIELVAILFGLRAYNRAETWYRARRQ